MSTGKPTLHLALACNKCKAPAGHPCVRPDGTPLARSKSHHSRTPQAPCGSPGAYQQHKKAGEEACGPCREANRRYMAEYRRKNPDKYAKDIDGLRAVNRATARLVERYRDEWRSLVAEEKVS